MTARALCSGQFAPSALPARDLSESCLDCAVESHNARRTIAQFTVLSDQCQCFGKPQRHHRPNPADTPIESLCFVGPVSFAPAAAEMSFIMLECPMPREMLDSRAHQHRESRRFPCGTIVEIKQRDRRLIDFVHLRQRV
jgi:hypothetical protein